MHIYITRPQKEDIDELHKLFITVITDAYKQEGINDDAGIREEVKTKLGFLDQDFASNGSEVFFLIARTEDKIVGTIAYGEPSTLITDNVDIDFHNIPEITTVFVLPEFQGKGVGSLLFNAILLSLTHKNVDTVCLDGGYKKSQKFWIKVLGNPSVTLKDYWAKGADHMIWVRKLRDLKIRYSFNLVK